MEAVRHFVEGKVEDSKRKVMAGDEAISCTAAVTIAMKAASMAARASAVQMMTAKRLDWVMSITGHLIGDHAPEKAAALALEAVNAGIFVVAEQELETMAAREARAKEKEKAKGDD